MVTLGTVSFWNGASSTPSSTAGVAFSTVCPSTTANDKGLQWIEVRVTDERGGTTAAPVVKRRA